MVLERCSRAGGWGWGQQRLRHPVLAHLPLKKGTSACLRSGVARASSSVSGPKLKHPHNSTLQTLSALRRLSLPGLQNYRTVDVLALSICPFSTKRCGSGILRDGNQLAAHRYRLWAIFSGAVLYVDGQNFEIILSRVPALQ